MIVVTFALPAESSAFIALLQNQARLRPAGFERITGTLHGQSICVMHTGVGEKSARARLGHFLNEEMPTLLISAGFAGALRDTLQVGDVLLAENFSTAALLANAGAALGASQLFVASLTTAHTVIDSSATRQQIRDATGAAAVDMETEFIAELCAARGIPMLSLRAITDTPSCPFPAPPQVLFNMEQQKTEFAPLFRYLLLRPAAIVRFISFAQNIAKSRHALTAAVNSLLREPLVRADGEKSPL